MVERVKRSSHSFRLQEWLESEGIEVQCPESIPTDAYVDRLICKLAKETHRSGHSDLKEIMPDRWGGEPNIGNKAFFQWNGEICRFKAILPDQQSTENDRRKFLIHVNEICRIDC